MQPHRQTTSRLALLAAMALGTTAYGQILFINQTADIFAPSFRDLTNADLGNSTYYGWGPQTFDGTTNNELIDNPAPSLGLGGLNGTLGQLGTADILASSNNIFIFTPGRTETLTMQIPTNGTPGLDGFTTIIIQGMTAGTGAGLLTYVPIFAPINGISPTFVSGLNSQGFGQWFAKYEIPGNAAVYNLTATVSNLASTPEEGQSTALSIATLTFDTQYSTIGYAPDTAQAVPEPASIGLLGLGGLALVRRRRGSSAK